MADIKMADLSYEVPIMLSPEHLAYEDIAKLNPFYEEYRAFWNMFPDATDSTFSSSRGSSRTSSLQSIHSEIDSAFFPLEMSSSPSLKHIQPCAGLYLPKKLNVSLHNGYQHKPSISECDNNLVESQFASFVQDDHSNHLLSPVKKATEIDLDLGNGQIERRRLTHKKLFGSNGWLGSNADLQNQPNDKQKPKIFKVLGKRIKQHVEEIAEDMAKAYPKSFGHGSRRPRIVPEATIPISLNPPTQAKLYSEMEVMICVSANKFLVHQYDQGRISEESIKRVTKFWEAKNRPQVVEFQFDQATQRQLILSNIRTLRFNGESSTNPVLLNSNIHNWKAVVKEMSIRTFCAPDSAIRKHMHDIHKLLDMLGAPAVTLLAFEELQMRTLTLMKECRKTNYQFGRCDSTLSGSSGGHMEDGLVVSTLKSQFVRHRW